MKRELKYPASFLRTYFQDFNKSNMITIVVLIVLRKTKSIELRKWLLSVRVLLCIYLGIV